jgi:hypothetical protein
MMFRHSLLRLLRRHEDDLTAFAAVTFLLGTFVCQAIS